MTQRRKLLALLFVTCFIPLAHSFPVDVCKIKSDGPGRWSGVYLVNVTEYWWGGIYRADLNWGCTGVHTWGVMDPWEVQDNISTISPQLRQSIDVNAFMQVMD